MLDYIDFDRPPADRTIGCVPEGDPYSRRLLHFATPGATNDPASPPALVFINEWMAANSGTVADPVDGDFDDWLELYNASSVPVDLTGFLITDNLTNGSHYIIPPGYVIPPHGFLLVWADSETNQNSTNSPALHVSFRLDAGGEQIALMAPDATLIDAVVFGSQSSDVSAGRFPDGTGFMSAQIIPTPGQPNADPGSNNTPPILPPLSNRAVAPGQTLQVQIVAVDTDLPAQTLTYGLAPGAPAGSGINPFSGWFVWTPPAGAPHGAYPVTVLVSDNGVPPRTSSGNFNVIVVEAPSVRVSADSVNGLRLEWATMAGVAYQVYFKDEIDEPAWRPLGQPIPGTGQPAGIVDPDLARPHRFYIVTVEP
jgi:hypothetical protein